MNNCGLKSLERKKLMDLFVQLLFELDILCIVLSFFPPRPIFQGICSAYDIIVACAVDPLQLLGLRKTEKSSTTNGHSNGNSKVRPKKCLVSGKVSVFFRVVR